MEPFSTEQHLGVALFRLLIQLLSLPLIAADPTAHEEVYRLVKGEKRWDHEWQEDGT